MPPLAMMIDVATAPCTVIHEYLYIMLDLFFFILQLRCSTFKRIPAISAPTGNTGPLVAGYL